MSCLMIQHILMIQIVRNHNLKTRLDSMVILVLAMNQNVVMECTLVIPKSFLVWDNLMSLMNSD
jgi:hypothetical protein